LTNTHYISGTNKTTGRMIDRKFRGKKIGRLYGPRAFESEGGGWEEAQGNRANMGLGAYQKLERRRRGHSREKLKSEKKKETESYTSNRSIATEQPLIKSEW